MSSCLTNPSRPKVASILLVIALKVRSLSSSRGGAGLDLRASLPPKRDLSLPLPLAPLLLLLLLLPPTPPPPLLLLLLLGGRGLLPSLFRFGSELLLEEPNFGEPLDFEIDFDEPLELLLFGNAEVDEDDDDNVTDDDDGFFDEDGLEEDFTPVLDEELPLLTPLLDGILGRPGDDDDDIDEEDED